jgi:hypothetical protein
MPANKTVETGDSVSAYLNTIKDANRKKDCTALVKLLKEELTLSPKMWGTSIIGFGSYHYQYESGREGDAPMVGMSSRANAIVLYLDSNSPENEKLLSNLGKYKKAKGCLYIQKLSDVNTVILLKLAKNTIESKKKLYPDKK